MKIKKKIEGWLKKERLTDNAEFKGLYREYQDAKKQYSEAKGKLRQAKVSVRDATGEHGEQHDMLPELMMQYRRERYMNRYHREGFRLVKHRFQRWVNKYLKSIIDNPDLASEIQTSSRELADAEPKRRPNRLSKSDAKAARKAAASADAKPTLPVPETPAKKAGRPRKALPAAVPAIASSRSSAMPAAKAVKMGRPRTVKPIPVTPAEPSTAPLPVASAAAKPPGRPRKAAAVEPVQPVQPLTAPPAKSPGRPRRKPTTGTAEGGTTEKRGPGRPRRTESGPADAREKGPKSPPPAARTTNGAKAPAKRRTPAPPGVKKG